MSLLEACRRNNVPVPETFITDERFHELIEKLKEIAGKDDEETDTAIQYALIDIGRIAPESSRSYYVADEATK